MNFRQLSCFSALFLIAFTNVPVSSQNAEEPIILTPVPPPIKVGWKTYYIQTFVLANWYRASQFCRYQGMQLASIENEEEQIALAGHLNSTSRFENFWTSGQNLAQNDTWVWSSNGNTVIYDNWDQGEPNNLGGQEHCIELRVSGLVHGFRWNDKICSYERYFICEKVRFTN